MSFDHHGYWIWDANGNLVVSPLNGISTEVNMRLVVMAPELLEALENALTLMEPGVDAAFSDYTKNRVLAHIKEVIAKTKDNLMVSESETK